MTEHLDKINIKQKVSSGEAIILELGAGNKRTLGRINIDRINLPTVDIVADLEHGLGFIPDHCVDEIHCTSFLEHINNFPALMLEFSRILKKDGKIFIFVPHFSNPYFYSDYTHKRFFGYYTFYYFSKSQRQIRRKVPSFYTNLNFEVSSQRLVFRSAIPGFGWLNQLFEWFFNKKTWLQEFYEAYLTSVFSCYGLKIVLKKIS